MSTDNQKTHQPWRATSIIQSRARELRKVLTPAESKLWQHLRYRQLAGAHFRRQHAVGRFILDFYCAKAKLVIELDGESHLEQAEYDAARTDWLCEQKALRVLRFSNDQVFDRIEAVLKQILEAVVRGAKTAPIPDPSPVSQGKGGTSKIIVETTTK